MALLEILQFPDPRLRTIAKPITTIDQKLHKIIDDMYETMYHHNGLGLAGTQVNIHQRIFTMDLSEERNQPICVINPEILHQEGKQYDYHGCLSVGCGISDKIERAAKLTLSGMGLDGKTVEWEMEETSAICVQHEIDHLNGILFIDHLSKIKRDRIRTKIDKIKRRT